MKPEAVTPEVQGRWVGPKEGPVFFGLHGWSGDHRSFDPLLPHLPPGAALFTVDQPGFGASAPPDAWSYDAYCARLLEALDARGISQCTLLGNCAGAVIGMELAMRAPERFSRLVLIDPFAYVPWYFVLLTAPVLGPFFYRATFANPLGRLITNLALASKRTEQTDLTEGFAEAPHAVTFAYLRMLCRGADAGRYRDLRHPITLLHGANSFTAVKRSVQIYGAQWPHATRHVLDGAGHLPIQEATEDVAALGFDIPGRPEKTHGNLDEPRRVPDAPRDAPDRPHLGHHPRVGAALQSHSARADQR